MWVISSGKPEGAMVGLGFVPRASWSLGVYALPEAWGVFLVVLSELPRVRETLILRLMGSGKVLREAIEDLKALPADAPERQVIEPLLVRMQVEIRAAPRPRTDDEEDFVMNSQELMEQFQSKLRDEGREEGLEEGLRRGLLAAYAARFGVAPGPLAKALQATRDPTRLIGLAALFATGTPEQIAGELGVKLH
ncbi:MAG: hypothetical protein HY901_24720 [Deltaproteobacteria bacterium]|nr:hypothetical protein [Deltaproteobacteria bacterium]